MFDKIKSWIKDQKQEEQQPEEQDSIEGVCQHGLAITAIATMVRDMGYTITFSIGETGWKFMAKNDQSLQCVNCEDESMMKGIHKMACMVAVIEGDIVGMEEVETAKAHLRDVHGIG